MDLEKDVYVDREYPLEIERKRQTLLFKVTSKEDQDTVGFFGEINPLSNFHPASFQLEGIDYISSEQYIQASKAKYFSDYETLNKILGSTTSIECKDLS